LAIEYFVKEEPLFLVGNLDPTVNEEWNRNNVNC
jgi:hypothetical protein